MDEAAQAAKQLTDFLREKISGLTPETIDGKKTYVIRCRSGEMRARLPFRFSGGSPKAPVSVPVPVEGEATEGRAAPASETRAVGDLMIKGTASSTSEDWYGTEMSAPCLMDMAAQFNRGVALMPSHGTWLNPLEWDDQMGTTTLATIDQAEIAAKSEPSEMGYKLGIEGKLSRKKPKCLALVECLDEGQVIGLSIGGWFLEIRYIMGEDEYEIERIIVEKVELDHLAIVRNPANPDCADLQIMRSVASEAIRGRKPAPASAAPATTLAQPEEQRAVPGKEEAPENNRADPGIATQTETENKPEEARATEISMTREEVEAMIADAVRRGVEAGRASAGAAPAETQEQELARLRSENEAFRNVRNQPRRSGNGYVRGIVNGDVNPQSYEGLFGRVKQLMGEDASIVRCLEGHKAVITMSSRARGEKGKQYRAFTEEAPEILREICCAAEDDGLIGDMQRGWML